MMISIISAIAKNRVIGSKNGLPWHLPADFAYFKNKTLGKVLIMGLNTFKSIGEKPLPGRKHIILCDLLDYKVPENCFVAKSIDEAVEMAKKLSKEQGSDEIMICGGAFVYKQFLPLADRLYLTYIHQDFEGDVLFPEFDLADWKEVGREDHQPDDPSSHKAAEGRGKNKWPYSFVVLERKQ
jgi:dihydrofolate reductase